MTGWLIGKAEVIFYWTIISDNEGVTGRQMDAKTLLDKRPRLVRQRKCARWRQFTHKIVLARMKHKHLSLKDRGRVVGQLETQLERANRRERSDGGVAIRDDDWLMHRDGLRRCGLIPKTHLLNRVRVLARRAVASRELSAINLDSGIVDTRACKPRQTMFH